MSKPANILVLTYWSLPDALIQTYTLPYLRLMQKHLPAGSTIYLQTLEKDSAVLKERTRYKEELAKIGIAWMPYPYHPFGWRAMLSWIGMLPGLALFVFRRRIGVIHCWAMPSGSIGYMLSLLTGRPLVIDSYEPHAEAMVENGTWTRRSLAFRILFFFERLQTQRATYLIAANEKMVEYAQRKYGKPSAPVLVKPACVDLDQFTPAKAKNARLLQEMGLEDKIVCVYAGKFGGIYLDREVFDFLAVAHQFWGSRFRVLLLTNHADEEIDHYCAEAGLDREILVVRFVAHREIPIYLGLGDFALTPVKPVPTKRYCTPIKDGEYWAMGLPVVIPRGISEDSDIIETQGIGAVLDAFDPEAYRKAVQKIDEQLKQGQPLGARIRQIAGRFRGYALADSVYAKVYGKDGIGS